MALSDQRGQHGLSLASASPSPVAAPPCSEKDEGTSMLLEAVAKIQPLANVPRGLPGKASC